MCSPFFAKPRLFSIIDKSCEPGGTMGEVSTAAMSWDFTSKSGSLGLTQKFALRRHWEESEKSLNFTARCFKIQNRQAVERGLRVDLNQTAELGSLPSSSGSGALMVDQMFGSHFMKPVSHFSCKNPKQSKANLRLCGFSTTQQPRPGHLQCPSPTDAPLLRIEAAKLRFIQIWTVWLSCTEFNWVLLAMARCIKLLWRSSCWLLSQPSLQ